MPMSKAPTSQTTLRCRTGEDGLVRIDFMEQGAVKQTLAVDPKDAGLFGASLLEAAARGHIKAGRPMPDLTAQKVESHLVPSTAFGLMPLKGKGHTALLFGCGSMAVGFPVPDDKLRELGEAMVQGASALENDGKAG